MLPANRRPWTVVRRRFITYAAYSTAGVVGFSAIVGVLLGGAGVALTTAAILLVFITVAMLISFFELRRRYLHER